MLGGGGGRSGAPMVVVSGSDTRQAAPHPRRRKSLTLAVGRVAKIDDVISYEVESRLRSSHPAAPPFRREGRGGLLTPLNPRLMAKRRSLSTVLDDLRLND